MFYTKTFVNSWIGLLKTRLLIVIIDGRPTSFKGTDNERPIAKLSPFIIATKRSKPQRAT